MDPELVEILIRAVENEWDRAGRPFPGTQVGQILRSEYLARGLETGIGAYRPVLTKAIESGRIVRVMDGQAMFLKPVRASEKSDSDARSGVSLGIADVGGYLRREIYDAFTGRSGPTWIDLSVPPKIQVHKHPGDNLVQIDPVNTSLVIEAWKKFSDAWKLSDFQHEAVMKQLQEGTAKTIWGRIGIPGDSSRLNLGVQFWRIRFGILAAEIRAWFSRHGKNADHYAIMDVSGGSDGRHQVHKREALTLPHGAESRDRSEYCQRLRARLHSVIDRMSLEQLCQISVPAEFLE